MASGAHTGERRITRLSYAGEAGAWEIWRTMPHPALSPYVIDYSGYRESGAGDVWRRELPVSYIPLIINFAEAFTIRDRPDSEARYGSFAAGVYAGPVIVGSRGNAHCLQVNFSPLGAYRFFRLSQAELAGRTLALDDLLGAAGLRLVAKLHDAAGWPQRFALLDSFIAARFETARAPSATVRAAWQGLVDARGAISVAALAAGTAVSRRHLAQLFRAEIGMTPKTMARILRFEHARDLARSVPRLAWADLAYEAGYADQAHLVREFRDLSGLSPGELLGRDRAETGVLESN
ncbi:helix-turn-helix domain-containing protein [Taklimakanibacter lacteus]|uniref:helix-turn-helix domain-containing protein n=1 Tax=Taklimakanibacter lacteus TaxID=2268456 RepID=UPI000E669DDD